MLAKSCRLSRRDFLVAKSQGQKLSTPHFSAIVHRLSTLNSQPSTRYSVVVSTKMSKKAVIRNRLRRQIYSQLSTLNPQLSRDVIIFPRPSMLNLSRDQINVEVNSLLSKISQLP